MGSLDAGENVWNVSLAGFECQICYDLFDDSTRTPKIMPCGHTFCKRCMERIQATVHLLNCPTCRRPSIEGYSTNFQLMEIVRSNRRKLEVAAEEKRQEEERRNAQNRMLQDVLNQQHRQHILSTDARRVPAPTVGIRTVQRQQNGQAIGADDAARRFDAVVGTVPRVGAAAGAAPRVGAVVGAAPRREPHFMMPPRRLSVDIARNQQQVNLRLNCSWRRFDERSEYVDGTASLNSTTAPPSLICTAAGAQRFPISLRIWISCSIKSDGVSLNVFCSGSLHLVMRFQNSRDCTSFHRALLATLAAANDQNRRMVAF